MYLSSSQVLQASATSRDSGVAATHAHSIACVHLKYQAHKASAVAESSIRLQDNRISGLQQSNIDPGPVQVQERAVKILRITPIGGYLAQRLTFQGCWGKHNRSCVSHSRPDDTHHVAFTEVMAGGRDAIMVPSYPQLLEAIEITPMNPVSLLTSHRHADAEAASKKLEAAILGFQARGERMAISPVRQLIRGK